MKIEKNTVYSENLKGNVVIYTADKATVEILVREDKTASVLKAVGTQRGIVVLVNEVAKDHGITELKDQVHRKHEAKAMWKAGLHPCLEDGVLAKKTNVKGMLAMMKDAPSNSILMKGHFN